MSVTRFGVSLLNVVATIERPASHHGTARPDAKNSEVLRPARRPKNNAGTKHTSNARTMMIQSRRVSDTTATLPWSLSGRPRALSFPAPSRLSSAGFSVKLSL